MINPSINRLEKIEPRQYIAEGMEAVSFAHA
jgi:hypothetical protein